MDTVKGCPVCLKLEKAIRILESHKEWRPQGIITMHRNSLRRHIKKKHGIPNPDVGASKAVGDGR